MIYYVFKINNELGIFMKILLIEDDIELSTSIETFFKLNKHEVHIFTDGNDTFNHLENMVHEYDLYIFDLNIPNLDALELIKFIRKTQIEIPIIIMTALLEIEVLQKAFNYGCTEYINKPFDIKELDIRIKKIFTSSSQIIESNGFFYNKISKNLTYDNQAIELRKKEKLLIDILFKNIGNIVHTDTIIDYVWEREIRETYPIRQLVSTIRQKLPVNIIKTEIGIGYKIEN